jgi:hypothetical protein
LAIAFCETICLGEEEIIATNFGRNLHCKVATSPTSRERMPGSAISRFGADEASTFRM